MSTPTNSFPPRIIGHRGASSVAPENTLAAIAKAADLGARWIEIDAVPSADGVPVILHDSTLERTTDGAGPVADRTCASLTGLDAGSWFSPDFAGEPIPTLEQAIELVLARNLALNLEIKPVSGNEMPFVDSIIEILNRCWPAGDESLLLSSFDETVLGAVHDLAPDLPLALITDEIPPDWKVRLEHLGCVSLHCARSSVTKGLAKEVHAAGYWILAFTVNEIEAARVLFENGIDGLFTDNLEPMLDAFGE